MINLKGRNLTKKIYISILILAISFIILKHKKIYRYFEEQRYYESFVHLGIFKSCYAPHKDIISIFNQEGFNYFEQDQEITKKSLLKLESEVKDYSNLKIPLITHKVFFTSSNSRQSLKPFYVEELKKLYTDLNILNPSWKHYVWTNNAQIIPLEIKNLQNVEIKNLDEFKNDKVFAYLQEIIKRSSDEKPYLAEAADLVRLLVVEKYGGIYSDLDYEIYEPEQIYKWLYLYDFIGARETIRLTSFYANSFFAAKARHPIIQFALHRSFESNNTSVKNEYQRLPCNIYDRILFNGPVLMTIAYFNRNNIEGNNDIILPSWMMINVDFSRYKNNNCQLAEITSKDFQKQQINLNSLINDFKVNPILEDWHVKSNLEDNFADNIYYRSKYYQNYNIIGADTMCGSWINKDIFPKKYIYLNWSKN